MKCNYPNCFECDLPDCIKDDKDIRNEKRMERYYATNEVEKQRKAREKAPKCAECQHRRSLLGRDNEVIYYCKVSKRVLNNKIKHSPMWCQKRMGLHLSAKEKRLKEIDRQVAESMKAKKKAEKTRIRDIDKSIKYKQLRKDGYCAKCHTRKVLYGRTKCKQCLEYDANLHRMKYEVERKQHLG